MTEAGTVGVFELLRMAGGLLTVLGLVLVVGWIARRRLPGGGRRCLGIEERLPLGRGAQLVVVRAEGRRILLGVAEKRIEVLTTLAEAAESDACEAPGEGGPVAALPRPGRGPAQRFARILAERLRARESA